jgi:diguanylate cyclase (GGDEF)-like protein
MTSKVIKVLFIEDDPEGAKLIEDLLVHPTRSQLSLSRFELVISDSVTKGLDQLNSNELGVVLLSLSENQGLDSILRIHERFPSIPVIALANSDKEDMALDSMQLGAQDYLFKDSINSELLARSIRYSFERALLLKGLHMLSIHDELTGLYNRREMLNILNEASDLYLRYNRKTSLAMLDLDNFKRINDTYGLAGGDAMLKGVAQLLKYELRNLDKSVRYGGEEIAIIMPEINMSEAFHVAERLRNQIARNPFAIAQPDRTYLQVFITVSIGVASFQDGVTSCDDLINAADQALYEAKKLGRNRVIQFSRQLSHVG